jgi:uncharacterized integral membrane protein
VNGIGRRLLLGGVLALFATVFAWLNGAETVRVNLGLVRISGVSLPGVVFVAFLLGMLTLFLASLKSEMRTQRMLRRYREALGAEAARDPERPAEEG